jgi:hypothetical protein
LNQTNGGNVEQAIFNTMYFEAGSKTICLFCGKGADLEKSGDAPLSGLYAIAVPQGEEHKTGVCCRECLQKSAEGRLFLARFLELRKNADREENERIGTKRSLREGYRRILIDQSVLNGEAIRQHLNVAIQEARKAIGSHPRHLEARRGILLARRALEASIEAARPVALAYETSTPQTRVACKAKMTEAEQLMNQRAIEIDQAEENLRRVDEELISEIVGEPIAPPRPAKPIYLDPSPEEAAQGWKTPRRPVGSDRSTWER